MNWAGYRNIISANVDLAMKLKTSDDVEMDTTKFIGVLQQAAQVATPVRNPLRPTCNLPSEIKRLVAVKRKARSAWHKSHTPDKRRLFNHASNKLKAVLREMRNAPFAADLTTLKRDDHSIWKPIKSRSKPQTPLPPIRKNSTPPGPWAKRDIEKAELFATHLSEVYTPRDNTRDPDVERELATHTHPSEHLQAFTLRELQLEIKLLNPHRAPCIDLITAHVLQERPHAGYLQLLHILNAIRRLAHWPTPLKMAKIIMIPKPGRNPTDVASYRPISLLPII
jgi:hypothetical protein